MNNRIQFGEPIHPEIPEEELPPDSLLADNFQKGSTTSFRVYMVQKVHTEVWAHVRQTPGIESGGVLLGHPFKTFDGQTTFIVITAAIPQHTQDRSAGHFTVSPIQIAEDRREMEQHYPGLIAVGWYHSHPGHGVFLSGQDMTIVSSIYDAPWHVAMVIDPQRHKEGFFVGPEGKQIGRHGDQQPGVSWTGLRDIPDSVKAIAFYNQVRDRLEERRLEEARDVLRQLQGLVEGSSQLIHWQDREEYRNLTTFQSKINDVPSQQSLLSDTRVNPRQMESREIHNETPRLRLPEPVRRRKGWSPIHWLMLSAVSAVGFAVFTLIAVFLIKVWPYWVTLGWGVLLSFLAVVLAGYVVFSKEEIELSQSNQLEMRPLHIAGERIMALCLVGLILILWVSYGVFSAKLLTPIDSPMLPESPTITASQTSIPTTIPPSATVTSTHTPTLTPTSTPTDTPIPSPTPMDTLTPTYTPTWTPTATSTITTPILTETAIPTPTIETTSTNSITL